MEGMQQHNMFWIEVSIAMSRKKNQKYSEFLLLYLLDLFGLHSLQKDALTIQTLLEAKWMKI